MFRCSTDHPTHESPVVVRYRIGHTIVSPGNLQRQSYNLGSQRALYMFPTRRSSTRGLNQVYGRADCGTPGTTMTCALASRQPSDSLSSTTAPCPRASDGPQLCKIPAGRPSESGARSVADEQAQVAALRENIASLWDIPFPHEYVVKRTTSSP